MSTERNSNMTVLVIDDDESIYEGCRQTLEAEGYRTDVAKDGKHGIKLIEQMRPNVVLVDLKMPGISGMDVLRVIPDIDPGIASIVITGYGTMDSEAEARKIGALDYLEKPLTPEQIVEAVEKSVAAKGTKPEMSAQLIDGKAVAGRVMGDVRKEIVELKKKHKLSPLLLAVQVGENPASVSYLRSQKKGCEAVGIDHQVEELPREISEQKLGQFIEEKNQDSKTTGIILQMPLPEQIHSEKAQEVIAACKDVEGVNPENLGFLMYGWPGIVPCTASAVMELIKSTGTSIKGRQVTLVGHSSLVGKPLALLLLSSQFDSATTTVCHIATRNLAEHTRRAEILIVAVGKPGLIKGDMIKEGAMVIDVGINRVEGKIVGDVVFEEAREKASLITPVPGGVGPVTTAMLLKNTLMAWKIQLGFDPMRDFKWTML